MNEFGNKIKNEISSLSHKGRVLFAVLTCEKLYPNYVYFQEQTKWGNKQKLADSIILIHESLLKGNEDDKEIQEHIEEVESVTPDTEDFSEISVSFALDACNAIFDTLNYLIDGNVENIVNVSIYALDTVDMFIHETEDVGYSNSDLESKIAMSQYMIREKDRQIAIIQRLKATDEYVSTQIMDEFRNSQPIIDVKRIGAN